MSINTWTLQITGYKLTTAGIIAGILNRDYTNSRVLRIWRVGLISAQTGYGSASAVSLIRLERYLGVSWTTPTVIGVTSVNTKDSDTCAMTSGTGGTVSAAITQVVQRVAWVSFSTTHTDTPTLRDWEVFIPLGILWDAGYQDSNVQPLTIRQGEMCGLYQANTGSIVDAWMEFTDETS